MSIISDKRIFYVNSRNRVSGTDSDFTYTFDYKDKDYDHVVVLQASIPKSYYLVQEGRNTFFLNEDGNQTIVTVPRGNYTRSSFMAQLTTSLNAASYHNWVYIVTIPLLSTTGDTGLYTFSVAGNSGIQPQFIIQIALFEQLGFNENTTYTFTGDQLISVNVIKLQLEDTIYIQSDIASNGVDNILQEVFAMDSPDFGNLIWVCPDIEAYSKQLGTNNSNVYRFYLTDEDGNLINLNGQNMVMTVMMFKKQNVYELIKKFIKLELMK